jgi:hypothetical protein
MGRISLYHQLDKMTKYWVDQRVISVLLLAAAVRPPRRSLRSLISRTFRLMRVSNTPLELFLSPIAIILEKIKTMSSR